MNRKGMIIIDMPTTCFECEFVMNLHMIIVIKFVVISSVELNIWKLMNIANCVLNQIGVH